ncbi:MAG TPA: PilN domain-containing protein [Fimbriimonadaceae bacterium]|nr:PilN domain-containing protein [Fimbriimonadaceae bacterium]
MPLINLIQDQRLAAKKKEGQARTCFLAFACISVVSVFGFGFLFLESEAVAREVSDLKKKTARTEPIVRQIKANDMSLRNLTPRLTTLEDATTATQRWNRILDHLARNTPRDVYLTNIRCTASDPTKPVQLNLTGVCPSQDSAADFLIRLQTSADLTNATLKMTQEKMVDTQRAIEFEISADLSGTEEKKPLAEKEKSA